MCASFALLMQSRQDGVLITPCKLAPLQVQAAFTVTPSEREGSRVTVYCTIAALRHPRFLVAPLLGMTIRRLRDTWSEIDPARDKSSKALELHPLPLPHHHAAVAHHCPHVGQGLNSVGHVPIQQH